MVLPIICGYCRSIKKKLAISHVGVAFLVMVMAVDETSVNAFTPYSLISGAIGSKRKGSLTFNGPAASGLERHTVRYYKADSDDESSSSSFPMDSNTSQTIIEYVRNQNIQRPSMDRPRTAMARERLESEMKIIKSLEDSNDGIVELTNIWNSGGYGGAYNCYKSIMNIEMMISMGGFLNDNMKNEEPGSASQADTLWNQAQNELEQLIVEHDYRWLEPIYKLGTLYYLQGMYRKSYELCLFVLNKKPWHIGATDLIVSTLSKLNNPEQKMYWLSRYMLPPLPSMADNQHCAELYEGSDDGARMSRKEWVHKMVAAASDLLETKSAELVNVRGILSANSKNNNTVFQYRFDDNEEKDWQ